MFKVINDKGFQLTFNNGLTISVMFGQGNYCDSRMHNINNGWLGIHECVDAEIGIWDANDVWLNFGHDTVKGYCDADNVANWITIVSEAKSLESLQQQVKTLNKLMQ